MKVYVTYACGHEGTVECYNAFRGQREWIEQRERQKLCPECRQREYEKENQENERLAQEMGLPELKGTPKQIAYGNTCRINLLKTFEQFEREIMDGLEKYRGHERYPKLQEMCNTANAIMEYIPTITDAAWFINARISTADVVQFVRSFEREYPNRYEKIINQMHNLTKKDMEEEVIQESIIKPENICHDGIVSIQYDGDHKICITGGWSRELKDLMRKLRYTWATGDRTFYRNVNSRSGSISDRIAEAGSHLLESGYVISVQGNEAYAKIKKGVYEPEWHRWVDINKNGQLTIVFDYNDDEAYHIMRETLGREVHKDDGQWVISPAHYMSIDELVKLHDFKITDEASSAIENVRKSVDNAEIVRPVVHTDMDNMQEHDGILDDLRDDDD